MPSTPDNSTVRIAATFGFFAVVLGAFGAHSLRPLLEQHHTTAIWEKAVFYHFGHALVLLFLSFRPSRFTTLCFTIGIILFSGSLYVLALTGLKWLGAITPLGGVCFLVGWFSLWRQRQN